MGYRSQVTAVIYPADPADPMSHELYEEYEKEKYEALRLVMSTKFEQIMSVEPAWFGRCARWDDEKRYLAFELEGVKWYDSYEDVKAFDAMLVEVAELGYCSEFIRIGEEVDDIEHRFEGEGLKYILNVQRTITID